MSGNLNRAAKPLMQTMNTGSGAETDAIPPRMQTCIVWRNQHWLKCKKRQKNIQLWHRHKEKNWLSGWLLSVWSFLDFFLSFFQNRSKYPTAQESVWRVGYKIKVRKASKRGSDQWAVKKLMVSQLNKVENFLISSFFFWEDGKLSQMENWAKPKLSQTENWAKINRVLFEFFLRTTRLKLASYN